MCHICNKSYSSEQSLDQHNKLLHAKKLAIYPCYVNNCEVVCTTPYNLVEHYKECHDENLSNDDAKTHAVEQKNPVKMQKEKAQKTKDVRTPYDCTKCGEHCSKFSNLKRHMLNKHKGIWIYIYLFIFWNCSGLLRSHNDFFQRLF